MTFDHVENNAKGDLLTARVSVVPGVFTSENSGKVDVGMSSSRLGIPR